MITDAIRLATRGSALALIQADLVAAALAGVFGPAERVVVQSAGDLRGDVPIHAIGGRGVFVKEIDEAVIRGRADVAVHSAKDLPSATDPSTTIAAFLPRADARDALVGSTLDGLSPGARVASGSVRRRAQLAWLRPDLTFEDIRGNIGTRLAKAPPGGAVVVAMAALDRLGLSDQVSQVLSTGEMLPQVGQGAIAICCRADDGEVLERLGQIDDLATRLAVEAERAWLGAVGGGCDLPVGAHCRRGEGGGLVLEAMIASLDGHVLVRSSAEGIDPETLGCSLAEEMLSRGGGSLLPALALTEPPRHLPAATTGLAS